MDAAEAERRGLVSRVVPAAELMQTATAVARSIASSSWLAVAKAKECVQRTEELSLTEGLIFEQCAPSFSCSMLRIILPVPALNFARRSASPCAWLYAIESIKALINCPHGFSNAVYKHIVCLLDGLRSHSLLSP